MPFAAVQVRGGASYLQATDMHRGSAAWLLGQRRKT